MEVIGSLVAGECNSSFAKQGLRSAPAWEQHLMVNRLLKKYKYPPDGQDDAVALVIRQAEVLAAGWVA